MIGSLLYLTAARLDIQFACYQASPRTSHRQAVKCIFMYLKFTPELGLWYSSEGSQMLTMLADGLIANQPPLLWMKATLSDFGLSFGRIPLLVDSTSVISVAKNPVLHSKTKHIDVRFHFLRDHYGKGDIDMIHVETQNQLADILTKPTFSAFARLRGELG
ncbi:hypothetical protein U9M48_028463, partial [Paspalum notatum var. saurae]